jgi:SAM-dependent methyltransferase
MALNQILRHPQIYQCFQQAGGFFGARVRSIEAYLSLKPGDHVIDVGCGPGFIVSHLPAGIRYDGIDIDHAYIGYAQHRFSSIGSFHCSQFDNDIAARLGPADVIMMNGLLHHLDDDAAVTVLHVACKSLKPGGVLFTLDGCFRDGQSQVAKWLLRSDRGRFVRTEAGYRRLLGTALANIRTYIREDLSLIPYTFVIGLADRSMDRDQRPK